MKVVINSNTCVISQDAYDLLLKANRVENDSDLKCYDDGVTVLCWYGEHHTAIDATILNLVDAEFDMNLLKDMIGTVEAPDSFKAYIDIANAYDLVNMQHSEVVSLMSNEDDGIEYDTLEEDEEEDEEEEESSN